MILYSFASSSSGNCYLYEFGNVKILVDVGINYKNLNSKLEDLELNLEHIDAILITHEHVDHVRGLEVLNKKASIPIYLSEGTAQNLKFPLDDYKILSYNEKIIIKDLELLPLRTSHDAKEPMCFVFTHLSKKYGHVTDTGYISLNLQTHLSNLHFYLIESNYDERALLTNEEYPFTVKKRINSDKGHMSNVQTNEFIKKNIGDNTKTICFGHLSEKNNDPELVEILNENLNIENKHILKKDEVVKVICK